MLNGQMDLNTDELNRIEDFESLCRWQSKFLERGRWHAQDLVRWGDKMSINMLVDFLECTGADHLLYLAGLDDGEAERLLRQSKPQLEELAKLTRRAYEAGLRILKAEDEAEARAKCQTK